MANKTYDTYRKYYQTLINHLLTYNTKHDQLKQQDPIKGNKPFRFQIPKTTILELSRHVRVLLKREPNLLRLKAPLNLFGDIHGQFGDLVRFIHMINRSNGKKRFIFNGDIVDRGSCSIECLMLLFAMKFCFPNDVYIMRGNHESMDINQMYGFKTECLERYGDEVGFKIWTDLNTTLQLLPICCTINESIFCTHGGIPRQPLNSLDDINKINRNMIIPNEGIMCDLMWSDPKSHKTQWADNERGVSYTFNQYALQKFMTKHNLSLVCRAHEMVNEGYKFFAGNKLVTIFSAPNYCGERGNNGAVMVINENMECSFIVLKPISKTVKK